MGAYLYAADIGRIKIVKGQVTIQREGNVVPGIVGARVQTADRIVTGADGVASFAAAGVGPYKVHVFAAGAVGVNPLPDQRKNPSYYYPFDGSDRNAFADEQFLMNELAPFEQRPQPVTLVEGAVEPARDRELDRDQDQARPDWTIRELERQPREDDAPAVGRDVRERARCEHGVFTHDHTCTDVGGWARNGAPAGHASGPARWAGGVSAVLHDVLGNGFQPIVASEQLVLQPEQPSQLSLLFRVEVGLLDIRHPAEERSHDVAAVELFPVVRSRQRFSQAFVMRRPAAVYEGELMVSVPVRHRGKLCRPPRFVLRQFNGLHWYAACCSSRLLPRPSTRRNRPRADKDWFADFRRRWSIPRSLRACSLHREWPALSRQCGGQ